MSFDLSLKMVFTVFIIPSPSQECLRAVPKPKDFAAESQTLRQNLRERLRDRVQG